MKITYLGSGGAEGVPAAFCSCPSCRMARALGGRQQRLRSSVLINDDLLIDLSPDFLTVSAACGPLDGLRFVLLTHAHEDHCALHQLMYKSTEAPLDVYGNEKCRAKYLAADSEIGGIKNTAFHTLHPFDVLRLADYTVTALPANHAPDQEAVMFLLEQGGKRFLYAEDTGRFPQTALEYLAARRCDLISMDCAFCTAKPEATQAHLGLSAFREHMEILKKQGTADENTVFIAQHFSHSGLIADNKAYSHDALEQLMLPMGIQPAFDGLSIVLP